MSIKSDIIIINKLIELTRETIETATEISENNKKIRTALNGLNLINEYRKETDDE